MMRFIFIEADTEKELETVRNMFGEVICDTKKRPMTNAERQKRYRENKKCNEIVTESNEIVSNVEEKREEEKESFPPSSPLPFSPNTPYPIPPIIPPSQEKEGERKEDFGGTIGKRGELKSFGPHVRLSEKEFLSLQEKYGYDETMKMIRNMNNYIGEDQKLMNKYRTRNHYLTLLNWKRRDEERDSNKQKQSPNEYPDFYSMLQAEGVI